MRVSGLGFRVYGLGSVSFKRVPLRDGFGDFGFRVQDFKNKKLGDS